MYAVPGNKENLRLTDVIFGRPGRGLSKRSVDIMRTDSNTKALKPMAVQLTAGLKALEAEGGQLGLDPFRDIRFATISLADMHKPQPRLLIHLGGEFPSTLVKTAVDQDALAGTLKQVAGAGDILCGPVE